MKSPRYDVTHGDGVMVEAVRDLDLRTARRLVERDQGAGRKASMAQVIPKRTYR